MRKGTAILLIIAAALTVLGGAIFTVGVIAMGNNSASFTDSKYQNKTYEATDRIEGVKIITDTADVELVPYDKEGYKVECFEEKKLSHNVTVKDGVLSVEKQDARAWYDHISFFSKPTKVTVYIPKGEYSSLWVDLDTGYTTVSKDFVFGAAEILCSTGDVKFYASTQSTLTIKASTGNVTVENLDTGGLAHGNVSLKTTTGNITAKKLICKNVTLSVSTGKTTVSDMTCESFNSIGNTGDIAMSNLVVKGSLNVKRSTGDVKFNKCDAAKLNITTDTGDVTGSLLSDKIFIHKTDTGKVSLPETTTGGTCKIITDTGDIKISITK